MMEIIETRDHDYAFCMKRKQLDHLVEAVQFYIEKWVIKCLTTT